MADPRGTEQPIGSMNYGGEIEQRIADIEARIRQLRVISAQIDEDGDPTYAAIQARQELPDLYDQLLDWTKTAQSAGRTDRWTDPNTGAQWLVDERGKRVSQLSDPIPGWTPGLGVRAAPQREPQTAAESRYDDLRNRKMEMELEGELTPWQQIEWDYKQKQDNMARQQWEELMNLNKQRAAWAEASDRINTMRQAAPMALIPGQTHFLGYEPGGAWQTVAGKLKLPFDPERFKVPVVNLDYDSAYQQAANRYGGR